GGSRLWTGVDGGDLGRRIVGHDSAGDGGSRLWTPPVYDGDRAERIVGRRGRGCGSVVGEVVEQ
ncbi:hypothetical protein, partial [Mycobacterium sp. IS-1556]|uniref:hypothetical protein n=1 Tax=Mycobacterium sp. IS-1556 TaxID=1772276 RepID=UPI001C12CAF0